MKCPKCKYQRTEADQDKPKSYCPSCGVIYSKAKAALLKKVAAQQKTKEEELQQREQELKKREATLQDQNSSAPETASTQPQPTVPNPAKPESTSPPTEKPKLVGSFTRYFLFAIIGVPGLVIMFGGIASGMGEHWVQAVVGAAMFTFCLYHLPPLHKARIKDKQAQASGKPPAGPSVKESMSALLGLGIIGVIGFFCLTFLKTCFAPLPVDIENGIAKREIIVSPLYNAGIIADTINQQACKIVEENSGIKGVELTVYLDRESVSDKYGNKAGANLYMGTVKIDDLAEVRKYQSCSDYSSAMRPKMIAKVNTMKQTGVLR